MIARYRGSCSICRRAINPGDSIVHTGRRKNAHFSCHNKPRPRRENPRENKVPRENPSFKEKLVTKEKGKYCLTSNHISWDSYLNHVEKLGPAPDYIRNEGSKREPCDFNGYCSTEQAFKFAREGWQEGIKKVRELSAPMMDKVGCQIERLDPFYTEEPGMIEFGRYLDGEPECCLQLTSTLVEGPGKFINILLNGSISWQMEEPDINRRGATMLALIELLEYSGCRVQLSLLYHFEDHSIGRPSTMSTFILLKPYEQPLDYNRLSFTALHPAALRKLEFRNMESKVEGDSEEKRDMRDTFSIPGGYGNVKAPSKELVEGYDIYFEHFVPSTNGFTDNENCMEYLVEELKRQGVTLA